jgi:hypothetical protein
MQKTVIGTLNYAVVGVLVALGLIFPPVAVAAAQGSSDPANPPTTDQRAWRLERVWLRQQRSMDRLQFMFDHAPERLDRAQERIDLAKTQGKDVASVQTALDLFSAAMERSRPDFESAKGILQSHKGFDAGGSVTDNGQAAATTQQMAYKLGAVRESLLQPGRDLRDAIRTFRAGNRPAAK